MKIPKTLIGTFQITNPKEMELLVETAINEEAFGFDTAPSYGTEYLLGTCLKKVIQRGVVNREDLFIQDKIDAIQMFYCKKRGIAHFVAHQMELLKIDYLDALLVHWPFKNYFAETWSEMIELKNAGIIKNIGICNLDARGFKALSSVADLSKVDIIQNEISPLNVDSENVAFFNRLGCTIEAYSPLCRMNDKIRSDQGLKDMAKGLDVDIGRLILKWHIQRDIHPVFTSKKPERLKSNLNLDFCLSEDQMNYISGLNQNYKIFPISHGCPGY